MASTADRVVCMKGWKKSGIFDAVEKDRENMLVLDPLDHNVDFNSITGSMHIIKRSDTDDDDSEWDGNIFKTLGNASSEK